MIIDTVHNCTSRTIHINRRNTPRHILNAKFKTEQKQDLKIVSTLHLTTFQISLWGIGPEKSRLGLPRRRPCRAPAKGSRAHGRRSRATAVCTSQRRQK